MMPASGRLRIAFLIRALTPGGAERQLTLLAKGLAARGHAVSVLVFYGGGALERDFEQSGVQVIDLKKQGRWDIAGFTGRLLAALRLLRADLLHSYLPSANILAAFVRLGANGIPVVWGMRASEMGSQSYDWLGRLIARTEAIASRAAQGFVCNSRAGLAVAIRRGYRPDRIRLIRNGIDTARFRRDERAGRGLREQWGVQPEDSLIGIVGRIDPMKGHHVFLAAAAHAQQQRQRMKFVIVGSGAEELTRALKAQAQERGIAGSLIWADSRTDMPAIYSSLDVLCSASYAEGTSNVIAEAMSCGCPCVATDVGDSAELVAGFGRVVPAADPVALGNAFLEIPVELDAERREQLRDHIARLCDVESLVTESEAFLQRIAAGRSGPEPLVDREEVH